MCQSRCCEPVARARCFGSSFRNRTAPPNPGQDPDGRGSAFSSAVNNLSVVSRPSSVVASMSPLLTIIDVPVGSDRQTMKFSTSLASSKQNERSKNETGEINNKHT